MSRISARVSSPILGMQNCTSLYHLNPRLIMKWSLIMNEVSMFVLLFSAQKINVSKTRLWRKRRDYLFHFISFHFIVAKRGRPSAPTPCRPLIALRAFCRAPPRHAHAQTWCSPASKWSRRTLCNIVRKSRGNLRLNRKFPCFPVRPTRNSRKWPCRYGRPTRKMEGPLKIAGFREPQTELPWT